VERLNLPFQIIETINESRATREASKKGQMTMYNIWDLKGGPGVGAEHRRGGCPHRLKENE
jgi:hypothetical protein